MDKLLRSYENDLCNKLNYQDKSENYLILKMKKFFLKDLLHPYQFIQFKFNKFLTI